MLVRADARAIPLATASVDVVVTSVPYLRQRRYGLDDREGGTEDTLEAYVAFVADSFDEIARVLKPGRLAWLNIGDKANGSGGAGGDWNRRAPDAGLIRRQQKGTELGPGKFTDPAYREGSYLDVPGAVVGELLRRGWRLRLPIIWDKGRQAPESLRHVKRPRFQHEMIYMLANGRRAKKRSDTMVTPFYPSMLTETGSVWHFRPGGSGPPHLAPFPDELPRRCILPSTLPGDLVLDPFDGSGTTRRVAESLGRRGVGLDLYAGAPSVLMPACQPKKHDRYKPEERRTVNLGDLHAIGLKPAVFYYATRRLTAGEDLEAIAIDLKLTDEHVAYIDERTRPEEATA